MSTPINNSTSKNILAADVEIKGTLKFAGELSFDGKLEGDIDSDGVLTVGENAVIKGTLDVGSVVVRGKVTGNILARDKVEMKAKAELIGDIAAARLVIEEGVTFVGKGEINPNRVAPTASAPAARSGDIKSATAAKAPGL